MVGHFSTESSVSGHWAHASDCTTIKKHAPFTGGVFFVQDVLVCVLVFVVVSSGGLCSGGAPPCFADFCCVARVQPFTKIALRPLALPFCLRQVCRQFGFAGKQGAPAL